MTETAIKLQLTRDLDQSQYPWLPRRLIKGTTVFAFTRHTYGCISPEGLAVSLEPHEYPFFEIPRDALVTVL